MQFRGVAGCLGGLVSDGGHACDGARVGRCWGRCGSVWFVVGVSV